MKNVCAARAGICLSLVVFSSCFQVFSVSSSDESDYSDNLSAKTLIKRLTTQKRLELLKSVGKGVVKQEDLFLQVKQGEHRLIKLLLNKGISPRIEDAVSWTPLHYAANSGDEKSIKMLLKAGAFFDSKDKKGKTPLDVVKAGEQFSTLAYIACAFDKTGVRLSILQELEERGNLFKVVNSDEQTILHRAALEGDAESVDFLLAHDVDPNAMDKWGRSPLHYAAKANALSIVKKLILQGAFYDKSDSFFKEPVDLTTSNEVRTCFKELGALFKAAKTNDASEQTRSLLLKYSCGVKRDDGFGLLHEAAANGSEAFMDLFCSEYKDCFWDGQDCNGYTALAWALLKGHQKLAFKLCSYGASLYEGKIQPLLLLIKKKRLLFFKACLDDGLLTATGVDNEGTTLLHAAAEEDWCEGIRELLKRGALYDACTSSGKVPLMVAKRNAYELLKTVERLFGAVEDGNIKQLQEILKNDPGLIFATRGSNETLFSLAMQNKKKYADTQKASMYANINTVLHDKINVLSVPVKGALKSPENPCFNESSFEPLRNGEEFVI
ncbi:TPA: hypothetical protein DDZ86_05030 [Candidatus Dependentiae bacterium]|nr:MAG: hypothetical protein A2Y17_09835 [Clostridiales bacterium GWF2_38_85]HBL98975.1 hypothetical protein [Candidatus Dependentiae bacterium]